MLKLLRDCALNNLLFVLLFASIGQPIEESLLWFLAALGIYRIIVWPIFKAGVDLFGKDISSIVCFTGAALFWNYCPDPVDRLGSIVFQSVFIHEFVITHAPFYIVGLALEPKALHKFLARRSTILCAIVFLVAYGLTANYTYSWSENSHIHQYVPMHE